MGRKRVHQGDMRKESGRREKKSLKRDDECPNLGKSMKKGGCAPIKKNHKGERKFYELWGKWKKKNPFAKNRQNLLGKTGKKMRGG